MTLNITTTDVPQVTREEKPNPFTGHFPTAEGKAVSVTVPHETDDDQLAARTLITQAQKAGRAVNTSTRIKREEVTEGTGKNAKKVLKLTMWSTERIVRKPKNANAAPTVAGATPGEAAAAAATPTA